MNKVQLRVLPCEGPWEYRDGAISVEDGLGGTLLLATVSGTFLPGGVAEANGRAMAAVPDLLAACEMQEAAWLHARECTECQDPDGDCSEWAELDHAAHCLIVEALAKACGTEATR